MTPYVGSKYFHTPEATDAFALSRRRLIIFGPESWEYYLGEWFTRQIDGVVRVPIDPPTHMTLLFRSIPAMDDRPLEERLQAVDMDYLTFRSISIGFIVDVTPVLGGMMVGGKVLDHWLVNLLSLDILLDRILLNLC